MSVSEHIGDLIVGAVAGAGGVYFRRRGLRPFLFFMLFLVVVFIVLVAAWYGLMWRWRVGP